MSRAGTRLSTPLPPFSFLSVAFYSLLFSPISFLFLFFVSVCLFFILLSDSTSSRKFCSLIFIYIICNYLASIFFHYFLFLVSCFIFQILFLFLWSLDYLSWYFFTLYTFLSDSVLHCPVSFLSPSLGVLLPAIFGFRVSSIFHLFSSFSCLFPCFTFL